MTHRNRTLSFALAAAFTSLICCAAPAAETRTDAPAPSAEAAPAESPASSTPLSLSVADAMLLALENNSELAVERLSPDIQRTFEDEEAAAFDPVLSAGASHDRRRSERLSRAATGTESAVSETNSADLALSKSLPSGTEVALETGTYQTTSSLASTRLNTARVGLSLTQSLLRGFGPEANLASLRQARLATLSSDYELRGFTENLVADVEKKYWDYSLALREIEIFTQSLDVATQALGEIEERINIGDLAEIELAAGQAEVARRREALINANGNRDLARLQLLRLISPDVPGMWDRDVALSDVPSPEPVPLDDVADSVALAMRLRPDMNQARLGIEQGDLELVKTKNGLLPRLELFLSLGVTGYADSFRPAADDITSDDTYDTLVRLDFEYPISNRAPRARHERSSLDLARSRLALANLARLVELDVRSACIEASRAAEQLSATAATRRFQEETLRGETEKFRVGKSTAFLVAQAQRDLLLSQIVEVRVIVNYRKALVELYRLDGSLLLRRGILVPGDIPPDSAP